MQVRAGVLLAEANSMYDVSRCKCRSEIESEGVFLRLLLARCRLLLLNGCCAECVTHWLLLGGRKVIKWVLAGWALLLPHRLVGVHSHHGHLLLHVHHLLLLLWCTAHHAHRVLLLMRREASHHGLEAGAGWLLLLGHAVEGVLRRLLCAHVHHLSERIGTW